MDLSDEARNLAAVIEVDAVVVGSGAGGGVAAARLTEAGMRVMVVEKSTYMRMADMTHLEAEAMPAMYEQAGYMTTHDGGVSILAGSTLGGGTKVNWAAALRTPDIVRKEWSERLGLADLAGPAFDEALDAVVERLGVGRHTSSGRPTDDNMCHGGQNAALLKGLCAVGADATEYPRNCSEQVCSAFCALGCKHGFKQSSDVTWLADAAATGHLHVLTSATALRVLHVDAAADAFKAAGTSSNSNKPGDHHTSSGGVGGTGGGSGGTGSTGGNGSHHHAGGAEPAGTVAHQRRSRVAGVLLTCTPSAVQAAAGAQPEGAVTPVHVLVRCGVVVSSAGTLHTPALLLRSGINGGGSVGRNLRLHPSTVVVARFPPDAALHLPCQPCDIEALSAGRVNKVQDAHTSAMKRPERGSAGGACSPGSVQMWEGPMMSALSREVSNWEDPGGQGYGSLLSVAVAHPGMLAANFPWLSGAFAKEALMHIKHSALMLVIVRDRDSGRVTIDDAGRPVVDYWPSQHDCESMIKGIELCVRAAVAAGASDVCTLQAGPAAHFKVTDATVKGTAGRTDRTAGGTSGGTGATAGEAADETSGAAGGTAGGTSGAAGRTAGRTMGGTIRTAGGTHVEDDSTPLQSAGRQDDESQQLEDLSRRLDDLSGRRDDPSRRPDDQSRRLDAYLAGVRRIGVRKYDMGVLTAHQMCSARLGVSPKSSVCDPSGECWEVAGLYVCDASVLPTCSGSNPMVTTEAMAWLLAGRLADAWKARRSGPSGPHDGRLVRGQASVPERRLGGGGGAGRSAEKPRRRTAAQVLQYEECREPDR